MPLVINENIVFRVMGKESVILDVARGEYFSLNRTGTGIFTALVHKKTPTLIAASLCKDYTIPEAQARADVDDLIIQLKEKHIIREESEHGQ